MSIEKAKFALTFASALFASGAPAALLAKECTVRSGPYKNALLELYTSEGCSSCPPADRWLSSLEPAAEQPRVIPIAFHVSYWDYIGWTDAFADSRFTDRQHALAAAAGRPNVYTPQVILDGADFRGWRSADTARAFQAVSRLPAKASIELTHAQEAAATTAHLEIGVPKELGIANLALVVALTENRLGSRVTAGENRGATLRHDFVARDIATFPIRRGKEYRIRFDAKPGWKPVDTSVVAFVQNVATGEVLQAVSSCSPT